MKLFKALAFLVSLQLVIAESIIDFSAARGDDPSVLGKENLQTDRDKTITADPDDLFIKLGDDPDGTPALHFHRIKDYIRAEYHALPDETEADQTYYIGYKLSLGAIEQDLMIFQFKAYSGNDADGGNANIPLSLEFKSGKLNFQYQDGYSGKRESQWSTTLSTDTVYTFGIVIDTGSPGWAELYFNGEQQTFSTSGSTRLEANTFLGRNEPKFGIYRGEVAGIDSYVYNIQIGTELSDITEAAGLGSSSSNSTSGGDSDDSTCDSSNDCSDGLSCVDGTCSSSEPSTTCSWEGHCEGATCSSEDDCSDDLVCTDGACASGSGSGSGSSSSSSSNSTSLTATTFTTASATTTSTSASASSSACSWAGHCAGALCSSDDDCSDDLACKDGACATE